ncbi:GTP cyclohydrolase II [Thauera sp.]|jgi:GTP cyclohydrolase II|uniref:GTP cyclohydrolase II n=1 Tax=Thauera sp. TaxID=1905334 RepID=UPI002BDF816E|nr:GTP cyclohydrolase II [Thauera sp.]HRO35538.1 GTP cyclohydrolase II [Thauera sp.]
MRQAERALFDLRRGLSILMRDLDRAFVVCAVEGLDDAVPGEMQALAGSPANLVLSGHRLAAIGRQGAAEAVAVALAPLPDAAALRTLAWQRGASLPAGVALRDGGLVERAALRLLGRAQLVPAALMCEVSDDRTGAVAAEVASGNLLAVDAAEVMRLCESGPGRLARISEARVPLAEAENSRFVLFREADGVHEHVAIVIGDPASWPDDVPVRLHSSCLTGDLFGSLRCDCGEQLRRGVAAIHALGGGVLLYLSQEGRGIGLANKLRAYGLQDEGLDTIDADQVIGFSKDERDFRIAHEMLDELGIARILLLTNNPSKVAALQKAGIHVVGRRAIYGEVTAQNQRYLKTKARRHGHWLHDLLNEQGEPGNDEPACLPAADAAHRV